MKHIIIPIVLGIVLVLIAPQTSPAQGKGKGKAAWIYLGEANVDGAADHDRISVGGDEGTFRAIQFRVERAPIEFERVVVHYRNGQSDPIAMRERIPEGGQSRAIDLPGQSRVVQSVEIWYTRARLGAGKPRVALYGRR